VPNSELIVARTAYKDNKSKYSINERTSNYTEVTTLLKDRGIDLTHKRFLILQVRWRPASVRLLPEANHLTLIS
jgi:structural maintenance of chromosome 4